MRRDLEVVVVSRVACGSVVSDLLACCWVIALEFPCHCSLLIP